MDENRSAPEILRWAIEEFRDEFAVTTSFQAEGMAIVDMAARISPAVRVLTLDTGRLPEETYQMIEQIEERYGIRVEIVFPEPKEVEEMVSFRGPNLFRRSVPERMLCCEIRKVRPLERKLAGLRAWAVGMRRSQGETRRQVSKVEEVNGRFKISPLADWSREQVDMYLSENNAPRHPLYARGYTSIGCAPCTRPTLEGEHERAGRWWWEEGADKECGIHFSPDGKAQRTVDILLDEVLARRA